MLKALDIVPSWAYALALVALGLMFGGEVYSHYTTRVKLAEAKAAFATARADAAAVAKEQSELYRALETQLKETQDANSKKTTALLEELNRTAVAADAVSYRLHDAAKAVAASARAQCATTPTISDVPSSGDPIGVLADVFTRADKRAGVVAKVADARLIALQSCINEYNAGRDALKAAGGGP